MEFLDDVDRDSAKVNNKFLKYDSSVGKWIGAEASGGGGGGSIPGINTAGISTFNKIHVGIDTGYFSEDLVVNGNGRVTGILTIGTGSITLDPSQSQIQIGNTMLKADHTTGNIDVMDHSGSYKEIRVKGGDAASKTDAIVYAIALG